ncbi:VOC family protein [Dermatobacter hominis]|uniref:VOC family protein n=1 Tax=Dermatobacter hominis TaxID=2884263 RepID=UPI001D1123B0|nr:VOC family protein [Dermatobacter hominis]UDY37573.1 VOC family protein [Dermatobacter hominis]
MTDAPAPSWGRNPDHITISVRDVDAAVALLGHFGFQRDHDASIDGGAPAAYMGMPDMRADHVTLALRGAEPRFEIQLLHFTDDEGLDPAGAVPSNLTRRGMNHLALRVDDLAAATAHLESVGVQPMNDELDFVSRKLRFFEGPEGVTIELAEWVGAGPGSTGPAGAAASP